MADTGNCAPSKEPAPTQVGSKVNRIRIQRHPHSRTTTGGDARVNYTLSEAGTSQKQSLRWGSEHVFYWENPWEKGTGNRVAKMWSQLKSNASLQRGGGGGALQCDWHPRAHPTQGHQWVIGQGWQWDEAGGSIMRQTVASRPCVS